MRNATFLSFLALGCAFLCALMLPVGRARAEGGSCPPGYYPIGGGSAGWQGCAPIPGGGGGGGGGGPAPTPMVKVNNHYAAAWHDESSDAWIAAGYANGNAASNAALSACNAVMGGGCSITVKNLDGAVAIARGAWGRLYSADDVSAAKAKRRVLDYCKTQKDTCTVINAVMANPGSAAAGSMPSRNPEIFRPVDDGHRKYGAAAWIDNAKRGSTPWRPDVWFAGGHKSEEAAKKEVLALCEKDVGVPCTAVAAISNTFLAVGYTTTPEVFIEAGATDALARTALAARCKRDKKKCTVTEVFNANGSGTARHDPSAFGQPFFTAQSWTKGTERAWINMLWSASGQASEAAAKKAAVALCEKEAKQACEVASWSFNSTVAIYRDAQYKTWISWMATGEDPARHVETKCRQEGRSCRIAATINARVAESRKIDASVADLPASGK